MITAREHRKAMAPMMAQVEAGLVELRAYIGDEAEDFDLETAATVHAWANAVGMGYLKIARRMHPDATPSAE